MFNGIHAVRWKLIDPNWIENQLMWGKWKNPNLSWVLIYKNQIISLYQLIPLKLEINFSKEHRYKLLPDKTQQNPENSYMPLSDQNKEV